MLPDKKLLRKSFTLAHKSILPYVLFFIVSLPPRISGSNIIALLIIVLLFLGLQGMAIAWVKDIYERHNVSAGKLAKYYKKYLFILSGIIPVSVLLVVPVGIIAILLKQFDIWEIRTLLLLPFIPFAMSYIKVIVIEDISVWRGISETIKLMVTDLKLYLSFLLIVIVSYCVRLIYEHYFGAELVFSIPMLVRTAFAAYLELITTSLLVVYLGKK